jgi:putative ABC transport system permease protein
MEWRRLIYALRARIRAFATRKQADEDLHDELSFHMEMQTRRNMESGMSDAEAGRRARLALGGLDQTMEWARDVRPLQWAETIVQDVRYAQRSLRRAPGFTTVAILTLAIGIAATVAMFSIVNAILLRPLPYASPETLVSVSERTPDGEPNLTSPANIAGWRELSRSLAAIAAWVDRPISFTGDNPEEIPGRLITDNYFAVVGVRPLAGRMIVPGDENLDFAVISHRLWQNRYGGDPEIVGRSIEIDYRPFIVVGVLPPHTPSPAHLVTDTGLPEVWLPRVVIGPEWRGRFLTAAARLAPGTTVGAARAEMNVIAGRLAAEFPQFNRDWGINVVPLQEQMTGHARPILLVLLGAVSLVLLIACANVANLFLGRAATRQREMALRRSLGAGRGRLVGHALTEAFLVAAAAGVLGLVLAHWAIRVFVTALPPALALPRLDEVALDYRVLAFAVLVSLVTGALFGALPALAGSRVKLTAALGDSPRGTTGSRTRLRGALVVAEVALALVLLAGAGLLYRTVNNLLYVDPGLRAEGVLTMRMTLSPQRYPDAEQRRIFVSNLLEQMNALPGVTSAGTIGWLPLGGSKSRTMFDREDMPPPAPGEEPAADIRIVSGDYFRAMGMPLIRGRLFDASDRADAPTRFVINEELARKYFPGEDPIGKRIGYDWAARVSGEVIGVVGSVREMTLDAEPSTAIYHPYAQDPWNFVTVVLRTTGDPNALAPSALAAVRAVDPTLPVGAVRPFEVVIGDTIARQRLSMLLLAGFAGVSLLLVVIGMYGVIAYWVSQRTREIGVRMALGAQRSDVLRMVVGKGLVLTLLGVVFGLAGALALSPLLGTMLYGVAPTDPGSLAAGCLILGATALVASYLPARRATRVDPLAALRVE